MTDYTKLVEELKRCSDGIVQCDGCSYAGKTWDWGCEAALMADAAAAIEELQDKVFELEEELNDADIAADDNGRQIEKLAKRNAELHAELEKWVSAAEQAGEPKRGEWIQYMPEYGDMWRCSNCHTYVRLPFRTNKMPYDFCPSCGAKMEVQDGQ